MFEQVSSYLQENVRRGQKMTDGLLRASGLRCTRKRLRDAIADIDPDGNVIRKLKRLKRRQYSVPGTHYLWHMDGCHKLIKYGFVVHTCIDGYSRYIVYTTCSDNNRANTVLTHFKKGSKELKTLPRRVRSDKGGENMNVCRLMFDIFGTDTDCFITGKSTGNQKVERVHRDGTEKALEPYIILFAYFVEEGLDLDNPRHMYVLHFLFHARINESLLQFKTAWNNHKVRTLSNLSPIQILTLNEMTNNNYGIQLEGDELSLLSDNNDFEDVVHGENQVVCESRYNPFTAAQSTQFSALVSPLTLSDLISGEYHQTLFISFLRALQIANTILG